MDASCAVEGHGFLDGDISAVSMRFLTKLRCSSKDKIEVRCVCRV